MIGLEISISLLSQERWLKQAPAQISQSLLVHNIATTFFNALESGSTPDLSCNSLRTRNNGSTNNKDKDRQLGTRQLRKSYEANASLFHP